MVDDARYGRNTASVSEVAVSFRSNDRLIPKDRRGRRTLAGEGGLSLLLHLLLLVLLLVSFTPRQHHDDVVPSSEVAVVFEGGQKDNRPQTQDSRKSQPTAAPDPNATEDTPPGQQPSRPSRPSRPAQPSPQAQPQVQPNTQAQQPASPSSAPTAAAPSPPLESGESAVTLPPPAPEHPARASRASRPTARATPPRPATQSDPFAALSAPMNLSLAGRPPPPASEGRLKRGINLSMAPTDQNRNVMTRYAEARHKLGEDWWTAFSNYVEAHKYYPLEAAKNGEDGQVVLNLTIARNGTVRAVSIAQNLASPQLGNAWVSEFRGKTDLPPFPPGTVESEVSFPASMTYILRHE